MKYKYIDVKKSKEIYWDWMHLTNTRSAVYLKIKELKQAITKAEYALYLKHANPKQYVYINDLRFKQENDINVKMLKEYKKFAKLLDRNITEFIHSDEYKAYKKDIYGNPAYPQNS